MIRPKKETIAVGWFLAVSRNADAHRKPVAAEE